jgi:O-antigen ligase
MSQTTTAEVEPIVVLDRSALKSRVASILGTTIFVAMACLIVLTAIPYGSTQPWWKAAFVMVVFMLAILWLIEGYIKQSWFAGLGLMVVPLAALTLLSFLQTLPLARSSTNPGGISFAPWNSISADPYQTRFFALMLLALTLSGVFLASYASSEKRLRIIINLVILLSVACALFGILRQTTQREMGFGLPLLIPDAGYGQFINKNHFAYLMEMSLGLILGLVLGGSVKREQTLIYLAALMPIWIGLVLCNSRGGLIAMLAQIIVTGLLLNAALRKARVPQPRFLRLAQSLTVRIVLLLILILGVVVGTIWLGGDRLATRIEDRTELTGDIDGLRLGVSRNEIWRATCSMIAAHPLLGVGLGGYWAAIPAYHNASGTMTPQEAHNDYLELLASGGLVGLALGIWFAVIVVKRTRENLAARNRFRRAACMGAAIGISGVAVHSLVDFGLHAISNALVFTTLIVIATSTPQWGNEPMKLHD